MNVLCEKCGREVLVGESYARLRDRGRYTETIFRCEACFREYPLAPPVRCACAFCGTPGPWVNCAGPGGGVEAIDAAVKALGWKTEIVEESTADGLACPTMHRICPICVAEREAG